jgi:enoyl-CoA hydratase/carnithine racemase
VEFANILLEKEDRIAVLSVNRPKAVASFTSKVNQFPYTPSS